ncbi:terpene synthase family protein [Olivibacter domesticus]|uniref:Terpene synthase n=1 Tax=Olivibacter domesticus TaxID=407022 RepID=A0A1H7UB91_OLID1|nr:terpene synthase family protein [Olivibacter domesticus]SEL94322.1 hypothetical protein SAMN05661044_03818 [Olivibacter domesticus]
MNAEQAMPLLSYPFPDLVNGHLEAIERQVSQWIDEYDNVPQPLRQKLKKGLFGDVTARFYPTVSWELLCPIARYITYAFVVDDYYGQLPHKEIQIVANRAAAILKGDKVTRKEAPVFQQLQLFVNELLPYTTPEWMSRFIESNDKYFESLVKDSTDYSYRSIIEYPTLQEYVLLREQIVLVHPLLDLMEIATGVMLSDDVYRDVSLQQLRRLVTRMAAWSNDFFSYEKERHDHEAMNLISVIQHEQQCSAEEAKIQALEIHDLDLAQFISLSDRLPDFGAMNKGIQLYVTYLKVFLQGHLSWYKTTKRYREYT